jgi:hypothetical protein
VLPLAIVCRIVVPPVAIFVPPVYDLEEGCESDTE